MSLEAQVFAFGEFLLDSEERVLLRNGEPVAATPKVVQLLLVLVENRGHIIDKQVLMESIWPDRFVEESNLTFTVRQLRKILGDERQHPHFIETVPRRGYRFIGDVKLAEPLTRNGVHDSRLSVIGSAWRSRPVLLSIGIILAGVIVLSGSYVVWRAEVANPSQDDAQRSLRFETLINADRPMTAAISPDGKYVAYTRTANGRQSLWLRQLSSGINTELVTPPQGTTFFHVEFSSDGEYVYFLSRVKDEATHLDRVSILGGRVKGEILTGLDGAFSISPDDRMISYRRWEPQRRTLWVSDINGADPRLVFETQKTFTDNVFAPDGKFLAFAMGQSDSGDADFGVYTVDLETGVFAPATDLKWFHVRSIVWLPDQSGLLVTARTRNDEPHQVWKIELSNGDVTKITDTQNDFASISASADLSQVLLVQMSLSSNLYIAPSDAPDRVRPIAQAYDGVAWTSNGDLVYAPTSSGDADVWLFDPKTGNQRQLTTESSTDGYPAVSPDGRYVVFVSDRSGKFNVWRMNVDGSDVVRLTASDGESHPVFTSDGQFVVFNSVKDGSVWKVPAEGGEPTPISRTRALNISISPDGTEFAYFGRKEEKIKVLVKSFLNDKLLHEFDLPEGYSAAGHIVWTRDGRALIYAAEDGNLVGNLWQQSSSGNRPQKLTSYESNEISAFDLSQDGSELAVVRGTWNHSAVLVQGLLK